MRRSFSRQIKVGLLVGLLTALLSALAGASMASGVVSEEGVPSPEMPVSLQPPFSSVLPPTAGQLEADAASRTAYEGLAKAEAVSLVSGPLTSRGRYGRRLAQKAKGRSKAT